LIKNLHISSIDPDINKIALHKLISELKKELDFKIESIELNFVDSEEIKAINKKYLNHNFSTDILTFDYSEDNKNLDCEIIISLDDAEKNAKKYKVNFEEEITRLVIHGILHLSGFDDDNKKNKIIMKRMENKLLNSLKFILLSSK
jgi:probable rRNA maturation factor